LLKEAWINREEYHAELHRHKGSSRL
jgi:hypothetical protein